MADTKLTEGEKAQIIQVLNFEFDHGHSVVSANAVYIAGGCSQALTDLMLRPYIAPTGQVQIAEVEGYLLNH